MAATSFGARLRPQTSVDGVLGFGFDVEVVADENARSTAAVVAVRCARTSFSISLCNCSMDFVVMCRRSHAAITHSSPPLNAYRDCLCHEIHREFPDVRSSHERSFE